MYRRYIFTKGCKKDPEFRQFSSSESKPDSLPQTDVYTV